MAKFATTKPNTTPMSKPKRESREDALARLLYLTWTRLVPDDYSRLDDQKLVDLACDLENDVTFRLFLQPAGERPAPTSVETRLGEKEYREALAPYLKAAEVLAAGKQAPAAPKPEEKKPEKKGGKP
jgi:hypothetical protein